MLKKEEVLARSKTGSRNKMEDRVNTKASYVGILTLFIACVFFSATKVINNGEPFFEFPAILFAYLTGMHIFNYIKIKKPIYLASAFAFGCAFLCMTVLYFLNR